MNPDDDLPPPAPPGDATASPTPGEGATDRPRRRRGPRKPRAEGAGEGEGGVRAGAASVDLDLGAGEGAATAGPSSADAGGDGGRAQGSGEGQGQAPAGDDGPRGERAGRRGRNRRRGRRGGERREGAASGPGAGPGPGQGAGDRAPREPLANELFAEVISGAFDVSTVPDVEAPAVPAGESAPPDGEARAVVAGAEAAPGEPDERARQAAEGAPAEDPSRVPARIPAPVQGAPEDRGAQGADGSGDAEGAQAAQGPRAARGAERAPDDPQRRVLAPERDAPKLHKVLAQAGVGSRRDLEQMIVEGRVSVNGEPAHTGQRISFGDRIAIDGKPVRVRIAPPPPRVLAYHKPAGEVVTHDDPQQRPTVFRRLPRLPQGKWQSVGRLDINTEGLLLFTNSGELANQLMHPRFGVEREYAVRSLGMIGEEAKARLLEGIEIEGQRAAFKSIEDGGGEGANHWYRVVITEGRNREVRKLFEAVGHAVSRLIRIRYGSVVLPRGLRRGAWVDLPEPDMRALRRLVFKPPQGAGPGGPRRGHEGEPRRGHGPGPAAPREGGPPPRAEAGREQRRHEAREAALEDGPPASYFERQERAQRQERLLVVDRPAKGRGRGRRGEPDRAGEAAPNAPHPEEGDFGAIPNPLQQTFDKRALQQERALRHDLPEDGPIPNPLQQTYDKRALQKDRQPKREYSDDGPIPNPLQQTFDKRFAQGGGGGGGAGPGHANGPRRRGRPGAPGPGGKGGKGGGGRGAGKGGGANAGRGGGAGKGANAGGKGGKGGANAGGQPDPMRTSVGYIGADAFLRKGGTGRGGRGRGR